MLRVSIATTLEPFGSCVNIATEFTPEEGGGSQNGSINTSNTFCISVTVRAIERTAANLFTDVRRLLMGSTPNAPPFIPLILLLRSPTAAGGMWHQLVADSQLQQQAPCSHGADVAMLQVYAVEDSAIGRKRIAEDLPFKMVPSLPPPLLMRHLLESLVPLPCTAVVDVTFGEHGKAPSSSSSVRPTSNASSVLLTTATTNTEANSGSVANSKHGSGHGDGDGRFYLQPHKLASPLHRTRLSPERRRR